MRLGFRGRSGPPGDSREGSAAEEQTSLALRILLRSLERSSRPHVLDLGAPTSGNLSFFSRLGARMSIADLYRSLLPHRQSRAESGGEELPAAQLLPLDPSSPFDIILAWDLLDYLEPREIACLARDLQMASKPGAAVLAFLATSREIPLRPSLYSVRDEGTLIHEPQGPRKRTAPRYPEQMLLRLMPGARVESRFQLRSGVLEYLFSLRGAPH